MVKSGLVDTPQVSPIRLAAHLSLAFAILGLLVWTLMDIAQPLPYLTRIKAAQPRPYIAWFCFVCIQIIMGAFMAGVHGGLIYNTWPTMNGQWIHDDLWTVSPWYNSITLIQFIHRKLAIFLMISYFCIWFYTRKHVTNIQLKKISITVAGILSVQFILGIITLLHQAPLALALAHQITGMLLFVASVILLHKSATCEPV